jgi:hypothetical protein
MKLLRKGGILKKPKLQQISCLEDLKELIVTNVARLATGNFSKSCSKISLPLNIGRIS